MRWYFNWIWFSLLWKNTLKNKQKLGEKRGQLFHVVQSVCNWPEKGEVWSTWAMLGSSIGWREMLCECVCVCISINVCVWNVSCSGTACVCVLLICVPFFATPWPVACQVPLSMEVCRQGYWSGLWFPSPGGLPDPGIEPRSAALQAESLPSEPPGKPHFYKWL